MGVAGRHCQSVVSGGATATEGAGGHPVTDPQVHSLSVWRPRTPTCDRLQGKPGLARPYSCASGAADTPLPDFLSVDAGVPLGGKRASGQSSWRPGTSPSLPRCHRTHHLISRQKVTGQTCPPWLQDQHAIWYRSHGRVSGTSPCAPARASSRSEAGRPARSTLPAPS